ncbi:MAG: hypothetical protein Q8K86_07090 [Candidatus Nanopelagicaceae bacterium]|nr:hypothetical protein [Candidatus Nanopelagicaceae bacterium]
MNVWAIDATIAYTNGTWKSVTVMHDEDGLRTVGGTTADLTPLAYEPTYKLFLAALGRSAPSGGFPTGVSDVCYRITATLTNGYTHVFGSADDLSTFSDDLATAVTILSADADFTATLDAIYPSSTNPQIIMTISGLVGGDTFFGLGNGVHTVSPTMYRTTPDPAHGEAWIKAFGPASYFGFGVSRYTYGTYVYGGTMAIFYRGTTVLFGFFGATSFYTASRHNISTYAFPFTAGPATTKIKNRVFGQVTTDFGVTISWQRASNWPSNP